VLLQLIVPIFLYLPIGMHASTFIGGVGNPSVIYFHILSCYRGLGRILVIFYVLLSLPSLGLTMGIGYLSCRVCESRGS
jgi:hypothetical protein